MTGSAEILSETKRDALLAALLSEPSVAKAAKAAKVSESTAWRTLRDPAFQTDYRAARRDAVEHAITRLQSDAADAARVLREVANDKKAPASARVSAAKTILEQAMKGVELQDVIERLDKLEGLIGDKKK
jgi:molybdenum-dependent DNA-binding transcriptional regulator ModE